MAATGDAPRLWAGRLQDPRLVSALRVPGTRTERLIHPLATVAPQGAVAAGRLPVRSPLTVCPSLRSGSPPSGTGLRPPDRGLVGEGSLHFALPLRRPLRRGTERSSGRSLTYGLRPLCNRKRFAGRLRQGACPSETLSFPSDHSFSRQSGADTNQTGPLRLSAERGCKSSPHRRRPSRSDSCPCAPSGEAPLRALLPLAVGDSLTPSARLRRPPVSRFLTIW